MTSFSGLSRNVAMPVVIEVPGPWHRALNIAQHAGTSIMALRGRVPAASKGSVAATINEARKHSIELRRSLL
jgi:hypothetical protein